MSIKIAVVGPIPRDTITTHNDVVIKKYGGVTNPVIALARLLEGQGVVVPIANMHKKDRAPIEELFSEYSNIDLSGINTEKDSGTVVNLKFLDQNRRVEKQLACMSPILPENIQPHLDADVFVFVPITDFEVSLSTLKYVKENSDAIIIFDAHGPTNCMSIQGDRHQKFWIDRDEWLPHIDVLKMNLEESHASWFKSEYTLSELNSYDDEQTGHLDAFGAHVVNNGSQILYVTQDSSGCVAYEKKEGKVVKHWIQSVKVDTVIDTTGCGDSFAGGLGYGFAKYGNDPVKAAQYANALGALRTQGKTFDVFKSLAETEALMALNYGEKETTFG